MKPSIGADVRQQLEATVKSQRFHLFAQYVVLSLVLVILLIVLIRERTVITPLGGRRAYEVGADYGDKNYLLDMSEYVLSNLGNVTPENIDHNNSILLKLADPEGRPELKTQLDAAAIKVKKDGISTVWAPEKEEISLDDKRVITKGRLITYIADKRTSNLEKTYVVEFKISWSGHAYLVKAAELVKDPITGKPAEQPSS